VTVEPSPILVPVAQEFDDRTSDALGLLTDSGLPVCPVPVSAYEDGQRHRPDLIGSDYDDSGITEPAVPGSRRSPTAGRSTRYHGLHASLRASQPLPGWGGLDGSRAWPQAPDGRSQ
jgi:hypothetical protein